MFLTVLGNAEGICWIVLTLLRLGELQGMLRGRGAPQEISLLFTTNSFTFNIDVNSLVVY